MSKVTLSDKQRNKIKRAIKSLNDVRAELQKENPTCHMNWYLEGNSSLLLMEGETHEGNIVGRACRENEVDSFTLEHSSGGGW